MIAHNLFGFDMFFFIKGYLATAWGTKDLNIGGTNVTHMETWVEKLNLLTQ